MSEWTIGTLKQHFDALRAADLEAVRVALEAVKASAVEIKQTYKEDKQAANEWRGALNDATNRMPSKAEVDVRFIAMEKDIQILREANVRGGGVKEAQGERRATDRFALGIVITLLFSAIAAVVSITNLIARMAAP